MSLGRRGVSKTLGEVVSVCDAFVGGTQYQRLNLAVNIDTNNSEEKVVHCTW